MGGMEATGVQEAVQALIDTDVSVADHADLATLARSAARVQAFVDTAKLQIGRRSRQLAGEGDTTSEHVLIDEGRLSGRDSKANGERERVCEELPAFEEALASGGCTAAHLDALARHTRDLSDAERSDLASVAADLAQDATNDRSGCSTGRPRTSSTASGRCTVPIRKTPSSNASALAPRSSDGPTGRAA